MRGKTTELDTEAERAILRQLAGLPAPLAKRELYEAVKVPPKRLDMAIISLNLAGCVKVERAGLSLTEPLKRADDLLMLAI